MRGSNAQVNDRYPGEIALQSAVFRRHRSKFQCGKLGLSLPFREWMDRAIADLGVALLPINVEYADAAANLPNHDGDPFDRMIVGQAHVEGMSVASGNAILDKYRINRLW